MRVHGNPISYSSTATNKHKGTDGAKRPDRDFVTDNTETLKQRVAPDFHVVGDARIS
jgi:hypothetical protein